MVIERTRSISLPDKRGKENESEKITKQHGRQPQAGSCTAPFQHLEQKLAVKLVGS